MLEMLLFDNNNFLFSHGSHYFAGYSREKAYINAGRLDYVIEIRLPKSKVTKSTGDRSIYLYNGNLDLKKYKYEVHHRHRDDGRTSPYPR